jgi:hypothetical protein
MSETYNFETMLRVEGTVRGYSKLDAYNSIKSLASWSYDTFGDSLQGRVEDVELYLKVDNIIEGRVVISTNETEVWRPRPLVPKAPEPEQVILPDSRMWLP